MPSVLSEILVNIQKNTDHIRNICLLAHVDHGKTTLADRLIASNLIISNKIAGTIRYLDNRDDEITRGITMKSSAISLYAKIIKKDETNSEYMINLVDSPGHIDFNFEISAASRLCDGALVIIDVIEGCCSQTISMLRHAWTEKLKPILIFNKIDRFILELHLSPEEAYSNLLQLLNHVNTIMSTFFTEDNLKNHEIDELLENQETNDTNDIVTSPCEKTDKDLYFSPEKGNVIICSAIDGWAFRINQFSEIYEKKLGIKQSILNKVLWGSFYLDPKTKDILQPKDLKGRNLKPMFVKLILENIWTIYHSIILNKDQNKIEKIISNLELKIPHREIISKDSKCLLASVFSQWLPLSTSVILSIIDQIPSPRKSQKQRLSHIIKHSPNFDSVPSYIYNSITECSTNDLSPVIGYVSKLIPIPIKELPKDKKTYAKLENEKQKIQIKISEKDLPLSETYDLESSSDYILEENNYNSSEHTKYFEKNCFIGFTRLYSGIINIGQELYVFKPKYDPKTPEKNISKIIVSNLYLLMGKELIQIEKVYAGNIFGIGGLEKSIIKNGTISSLPICYNLASIINGAPIVRVAIEPTLPSDMQKLIEGLKLLNQSDPCVQIQHQDSGEHIILTTGELHLEKCLKDLCEKFSKINIHVSKPIVPFRETIVKLKDSTLFKENNVLKGIVEVSVPLTNIKIKLRVYPLPKDITEYIYSFSKIIKEAYLYIETADSSITNHLDTNSSNNFKLDSFKKQLIEKFNSTKKTDIDWTKVYERIVAFGPNKTGPNILIDNTGKLRKLFINNSFIAKNSDINNDLQSLSFNEIEKHINTGFQLSVLQGPLAEEPMHGVSIFIEDIEFENININHKLKIEQITSHLISSFKDGIKQGFLDWSPRLMLSMYACDIQTPSNVLGKIHAIISKRRGRIVSQELRGTLYLIKALLPIVESFGFSKDIRKKTSGAANPQLIFSGFEILDQDPFWISGAKDLEDTENNKNKENISQKYINDIRKRKGLFINQKIIFRAEKQRTLKR